MHAQAAPQQLPDAKHLRELTIRRRQSREAALAEHVNLVFLRAPGEIQPRERVDHRVAPPLTEREDDHREEIASFQVPDQLRPHGLVSPARALRAAEDAPRVPPASGVLVPGVARAATEPAEPAPPPPADSEEIRAIAASLERAAAARKRRRERWLRERHADAEARRLAT